MPHSVLHVDRAEIFLTWSMCRKDATFGRSTDEPIRCGAGILGLVLSFLLSALPI